MAVLLWVLASVPVGPAPQEVRLSEFVGPDAVRTDDGRVLELHGLESPGLAAGDVPAGVFTVERVNDAARELGGPSSGHVLRQGERILNVELVREGRALARAHGRTLLLELLRASREAQAAGRGVWADRRHEFERLAEPPHRLVPPAAVRGVALPLHSRDPAYDYARELREIRELGAAWVSLQLVTLQERVDSSFVPRTSARTPTDERLAATIRTARELGLEVLVLPIVLIEDPGPDDWRGTLAPRNESDWWQSYSAFLIHVADVCATAGASALSIGSELASLEASEDRWKLLIANLRMRFPGWLTYSSNWDHFDGPTFWRQLDFAGMTAYFELSYAPDPSLEELVGGWRHARDEARRLHAISRLPVVFTEVGLPSVVGGAAAPWDYTQAGEPDLALQARAFEAFAEVFTAESDPAFRGMILYDWWGLGGESDTSYTARDKPAAEVWRVLLSR